MKIVKVILLYAGLTIASLVGLIFIFVEFRSLFAGDFTLFDNQFLGFLIYLCRGLYFASIIALCVFIVLFRAHKKKICIVLFIMALALLVGALLTLIHFAYYISLVLVAVTSILVIITAIEFFKKEEDKCLLVK